MNIIDITQTLKRIEPTFNHLVSTPYGDGYFVARDDDGRWLVCVKQQRRKRDPENKDDWGVSACRHIWCNPEEVTNAPASG